MSDEEDYEEAEEGEDDEEDEEEGDEEEEEEEGDEEDEEEEDEEEGDEEEEDEEEGDEEEEEGDEEEDEEEGDEDEGEEDEGEEEEGDEDESFEITVGSQSDHEAQPAPSYIPSYPVLTGLSLIQQLSLELDVFNDELDRIFNLKPAYRPPSTIPESPYERYEDSEEEADEDAPYSPSNRSVSLPTPTAHTVSMPKPSKRPDVETVTIEDLYRRRDEPISFVKQSKPVRVSKERAGPLFYYK
jgi:hypothetical protein